MCGRFVQYEGMAIFIEELSPQIELFSGYDAESAPRKRPRNRTGKAQGD